MFATTMVYTIQLLEWTSCIAIADSVSAYLLPTGRIDVPVPLTSDIYDDELVCVSAHSILQPHLFAMNIATEETIPS